MSRTWGRDRLRRTQVPVLGPDFALGGETIAISSRVTYITGGTVIPITASTLTKLHRDPPPSTSRSYSVPHRPRSGCDAGGSKLLNCCAN